jgi:hypothetical protein
MAAAERDVIWASPKRRTRHMTVADEAVIWPSPVIFALPRPSPRELKVIWPSSKLARFARRHHLEPCYGRRQKKRTRHMTVANEAVIWPSPVVFALPRPSPRGLQSYGRRRSVARFARRHHLEPCYGRRRKRTRHITVARKKPSRHTAVASDICLATPVANEIKSLLIDAGAYQRSGPRVLCEWADLWGPDQHSRRHRSDSR